MASLYEDFNLETGGEEDSGGFRIQSDQTAEWALRKISDAKAELARWEAFYEQKLEAVRRDTQNTIDRMTALLQQYFDTQERRVTKTGIQKYSLPSGELIRKPGGIDYQRDEETLLAWCEEHLPGAVKATIKASWSDVKAYIKSTGNIPDGVTIVTTEPVFQVKEGNR